MFVLADAVLRQELLAAARLPVPDVYKRQGQIIAEGPPLDVMGQQAVIDAYLGEHHTMSLDTGSGS